MIDQAERDALKLAADILERLPDVLAAERRRRGRLSQERAAEQIGVDRQSINRWESGRIRPDAENIPALLRWLAGP